MQEVMGFWIAFIGCTLLLYSTVQHENHVQWIEKYLRIPWYVQITAPVVAIIIVIIGWQMWCLGSAGHYPKYPLNKLCEWLQ